MRSNFETVTLGFRVKSGWAAAILLSGPIEAPQVVWNFTALLSDPRVPTTRQPYHAAMGKLETNSTKLKTRLRMVRRATERSVADILADCHRGKLKVRAAGLVVGSVIKPDSIANPHIRAHAFEGELFRTALGSALRKHRVRPLVLKESEAYQQAAAKLKISIGQIRRTMEKLGRSIEGPWRAEQKCAAIGAWMVLTK